MFAEAFIDSAAVVPIVTCMMVMVVILEVVPMILTYIIIMNHEFDVST